MPIPHQIRYFNKRILNPVTRKFAGARFGPFAVIRHVGRRSGKHYETAIMVWPVVNGFVIALTYGIEVDWYRNVLAAGQCTLRWHGKEFGLEKPESIDAKAALPAFAPAARQLLKLLGIQYFLKMTDRAA